jgi:glycosyltransferase involved in cell wall biosynthesis
MYTGNAPLITVILTACNRRRYLEEAINSTLNQTLSKESYEVIVIKNFEWEHDDHYRSLGVKIMNVGEPSLGKKVYLALKQSRGEIITLLNDDDLYSEERLSVVRESFGKYPDLALYHNESNWIDENGKPLKRKTRFFEHRLTRTIYVSNPRKYTQSIKLFVSGKYADSALAFRRSFIEADLHQKFATVSLPVFYTVS